MSEDARGPDDAERPVFSAEIRPYRSLGPRGRLALLLVFAALSAIISLGFVWLGAWPVAGFFGLDVIALWLALRLNVAQARACEHVILTRVELLIRRISPRGAASEWRFNPLWVRVETETDEDFGMTRLAVASRGTRLGLGDCLSPPERADFADAFGRALATARSGSRPAAPER